MAEETAATDAPAGVATAGAPGGLDFRFRQYAAANGMLNRAARKQLQMRLAAQQADAARQHED